MKVVEVKNQAGMNAKKPTLLLWLAGPLQSWGTVSNGKPVGTLEFPTRSGVLGMLACAAGKGGEQREWLARMSTCRQDVKGYAPVVDGRIAVAPLLRDFQTMGFGWDAGVPWQDMHIPRDARGRRAPKATTCEYVQDMAFACAVEMPDEESARFFFGSLARPVWTVSLGKKCCAPSDFIPMGVYSSREEAFAASDARAAERGRACSIEAYDGILPGGDETIVLNDVPLTFGLRRSFRTRSVTLFRHAPAAVAEGQDRGSWPGTHASPRPHIRRGHWHGYWTGPRSGKQKSELRWIAPLMLP